jgi:formylglycine-generating enzyme required for sulfatase activity
MSPKAWFRCVGLCAVLVALASLVGWSDDAKKGKGYALLVGVKDYGGRSTLGALKYTENDVEELAKVLDVKGSPFEGNVRILTCTRGKKDKADAPTAENIQKAVRTLIKGKKADDTVLVALSGHGVQLTVRGPKAKDKEKSFAYFCPQDADLAAPDYETGRHDNLVLLSDLLGDLGDSGAGVKLLLMDACRNDRTARSSLRLNKDLVPEGVLALFSCKTGQFAFETDKRGKGHGIFFYRVIEGLKGEAKDKKGRVTWSRLVEHVTEAVEEDAREVIGQGAKQTPHEIKNFAGPSPVLLSPKEEIVKDSPLDKDGKNTIGMKFALIPSGKFEMGSPEEDKDRDKDDEKQHEVKISKAFYLGVYEVKQKEWVALMKDNPSYFSRKGKGADSVKEVKDADLEEFPVESVSYEDAEKFIDKLNEKEEERLSGWKYSLPTEAQWEYACRGGATSYKKYHFGDSISRDDANFSDSKIGRTCKVGSYAANKYGLYDMHGNVWEWCLDWYDKDYKGADKDFKGSYRVIRGGSWHYLGQGCRAALRSSRSPSNRVNYLGFRVAVVQTR